MATRKGAKPYFWVNTEGASSCIVIFHEVWGLVPHTEDVCKRIGKLGFATYAPNLYKGNDDALTPDNIQKAMESVWDLSLEERRDKKTVAETLAKKDAGEDIKKVTTLLYDQGFRDRLLAGGMSAVKEASSRYDHVVTLGFCIGGGLSTKVAGKSRGLSAAVSFYGEPPLGEILEKITVPILAIYASHDDIINGKVPPFIGSALDMGKDVTLKIYPRTKHGFFNDSREAVYDRKAAVDSWELTKWFLGKTLGRH